MAYQVLIERAGKWTVEDYSTKVQAETRRRQLSKDGIKAEIWNTRSNPLSTNL